MSTGNQLRSQACAILQSRFAGHVDAQGYFPQWQDNLLPGVKAAQFQADLQSGSGSELRTKFRALHSSSALAVNTFASFKDHLQDLVLLGRNEYQQLRFEKKLSTGLRGTPPNLDVWLERENEVIAIESKFLEYLSPKAAKFSEKYARVALPQVDDYWWSAREQSKHAGKQYLDVGQLVKHAFGLLRYKANHPNSEVTLLYLFWEPLNAAQLTVCQQHRAQIESLAQQVQNSAVSLAWMSYDELWQHWRTVPALAPHVAKLQNRYTFVVQ